MSLQHELFTNAPVDPNGLPQVDELEMIPLESAYKTVRYLSATSMALVFIGISWGVAVLEQSIRPYGYIGATVVSLFMIWIVLYNGIAYHYMGYAVREKDISFKSGWLWKSMVTVPFNRVQHCDIRQGLIDRQFGLSKLTIYTAGGQSADLMIPGLLPDTAEKLKSFILNSTEQSIENE